MKGGRERGGSLACSVSGYSGIPGQRSAAASLFN